MTPGEKVLAYICRVSHLASLPWAMGVAIDDSEIAMAVFNGLPDHFNYMTTALDAIGKKNLCLDFVESKLLQK